MSHLIVSSVVDYMKFLNTLYNGSSTPPTSGEEDYLVWLNLANTAINVWENEEGTLWNELFIHLSDSSVEDEDGSRETIADTYSYSVPFDFKFSASTYVWIGPSKIPYKVIQQVDSQLYANDTGNWCYFLFAATPTLEFNPNCQLPAGQVIEYDYYKYAEKLTGDSSEFEMSDPMFAVYYSLAELKKEEGNSGELQMASQKLEAMKTRNGMVPWYQEDQLHNFDGGGFGI